VIFACEGKDSSTITSFSEDFQNHSGNPSNIRSVCCDMSPSYISGVSKEFPQAKITFDKFHVMKAMNEGVNEVQYFTNWIEKSFSFIPISKYFSVKCLKS
jgi:transposase